MSKLIPPPEYTWSIKWEEPGFEDDWWTPDGWTRSKKDRHRFRSLIGARRCAVKLSAPNFKIVRFKCVT